MSPSPLAAAPRWSSSLMFVLAATGAAVGLGNLWRFPFIAGENGGGAFVLVYLAAVALIGLPIMLGELVIGRRGRGNAASAVASLSRESGAGGFWRIIGALSVFIPFIGIGYYSVVAGWVVDYTATFVFAGGLGLETASQSQARFDAMLASPGRLLLLHAAFMVAVILVVSLGVKDGIERAARLMMPALFVLLLGLVVYAMIFGAFGEALAFLFRPNFAALTGEAVLLAVGQAFFSLAIGIGALITYGAYLDDTSRLARAAAQICAADTAVAILAGLAIFPIVFSIDTLSPSAGPGLIFVTLPVAFADMQAGYMVGSAFFILLFFAAFTTGIGTLEPVVSWAIGRGLRRRTAAWSAGGAAWVIGAAAALSFNDWAAVRPLAWVPGFADRGIFDLLDFSISNLLLPINGLFIALFVGWAVPRALVVDELGPAADLVPVWRLFIRLLAPAAIIAIVAFG